MPGPGGKEALTSAGRTLPARGLFSAARPCPARLIATPLAALDHAAVVAADGRRHGAAADARPDANAARADTDGDVAIAPGQVTVVGAVAADLPVELRRALDLRAGRTRAAGDRRSRQRHRGGRHSKCHPGHGTSPSDLFST